MTGAELQRLRRGAAVIGAILLYIYFRTHARQQMWFYFTPYAQGPDFAFVSRGEWRFLLLQCVLVAPAVGLLVIAFSGGLAQRVRGWLAAYAAHDVPSFRKLAFAYAALSYAIHRSARALLLRDHPVTDDENALTFGAHIVARGNLLVSELAPKGAFNELFLYERDGLVTSFDWPGGILFRALSIASGLEDHLYAMFAAVGTTAIVATVHRLFGARMGLFAAVAVLLSPLSLGLSVTMHAHVVSRTFIALAVYLYVGVVLDGGGPRRSAALRGLGFGACVGAALMTRPFETVALLGPLSLHVLWLGIGRRSEGIWVFIGGALAGLALLLGVFAAYNAGVTGKPWLPPRLDRAHISANVIEPMGFDTRLVNHVGFQWMLLGLYVMGPCALPLAILGALSSRAPLGAVGLGFAASIALMLAHDNIGIHTIGPIHYGDAVVHLVILVCGGLWVVARWLEPATKPGQLEAALTLVVCLGIGVCLTLPWMLQLARHGEFLDRPYQRLEQGQVENAIVIAVPSASMRRPMDPGSWQLMMPHADPYVEADIVFALGDANPAQLHEAYPERHIVGLSADLQGELHVFRYFVPRGAQP